MCAETVDFVAYLFFLVPLPLHFFLFLGVPPQTPGTIYWRVCSPPFHNSLENQYCDMIPVQTFKQRKANGKENSWSHDLNRMLQTNQATGDVKQLQRIRTCQPVPLEV